VVFSESVDITIKETCIEISKRYQIHFLEIGTDDDHVHFLVQSVPLYSPTKIVTTIKSITAREVFRINPEWQILAQGYCLDQILNLRHKKTVTR
jgi:REP element-mobilizing transposase RayT